MLAKKVRHEFIRLVINQQINIINGLANMFQQITNVGGDRTDTKVENFHTVHLQGFFLAAAKVTVASICHFQHVSLAAVGIQRKSRCTEVTLFNQGSRSGIAKQRHHPLVILGYGF
jgi:hypothetical protein